VLFPRHSTAVGQDLSVGAIGGRRLDESSLGHIPAQAQLPRRNTPCLLRGFPNLFSGGSVSIYVYIFFFNYIYIYIYIYARNESRRSGPNFRARAAPAPISPLPSCSLVTALDSDSLKIRFLSRTIPWKRERGACSHLEGDLEHLRDHLALRRVRGPLLRLRELLPKKGFHMQTLIIYKHDFNQNYYTVTLILLIKIVLCSKFP